MPFTLSHVAVAAPLARRGLVFSALVAGSIAPDLEYFLKLNTQSQWAHSFPGALLFPFPAALVALWCFHAFLKKPLLALLPAAHRRLLEPYAGAFTFQPARRFGLIVLSLAVGICIHLFLDSITHDYGMIALRWAWLRQPLFRNGSRNVLVCDACQALASLGLLLVLAWQYVRFFNGKGSTAEFLECRRLLPAYLTVAFVATVVGLVFAHMHVPVIEDARSLRRFLGRASVAGIDAAFLGAVLAGHVLLRGRLRDEPSELAGNKEVIRE